MSHPTLRAKHEAAANPWVFVLLSFYWRGRFGTAPLSPGKVGAGPDGTKSLENRCPVCGARNCDDLFYRLSLSSDSMEYMLATRSMRGRSMAEFEVSKGNQWPTLNISPPSRSTMAQMVNGDAQPQPRDAQLRSAAAVRMARHRQRRCKGLRCILLSVYDREIEALVSLGLLDAQQKAEPRAIASAVGKFLDGRLRKQPC
jgi:hypothetical protein